MMALQQRSTSQYTLQFVSYDDSQRSPIIEGYRVSRGSPPGAPARNACLYQLMGIADVEVLVGCGWRD
jgi:hypothetical protein